MKDAVNRIISKGNSHILSQLAERIWSSGPSTSPTHTDPLESSVETNLDPVTPIAVPLRTTLHIDKDDDLQAAKKGVKVIEMRQRVCNDPAINTLGLEECTASLVELAIGNECLQYLGGLKLQRYEQLKRVVIGKECCTLAKGGCFEVRDCAALKYVRIGRGSCVDWSSLTVKNCGLEEVSVGNDSFVNCETTVFESEGWRVE